MRLHGAHQVSGAGREYSIGIEPALVPQGGEDGVLASHGGFEGTVVEHVSLRDGDALVLHSETGRIANERRDLMAAVEGLGDELTASATSGTNDENSHSLIVRARSRTSAGRIYGVAPAL